MATIEAVSETLPKVLSLYGTGGFPKMPDRNNNKENYRLYHCIIGPDRNRCKKIDSNYCIQLSKDSHILSINKWIPESLDTYLLRFNNPFVTKIK